MKLSLPTHIKNKMAKASTFSMKVSQLTVDGNAGNDQETMEETEPILEEEQSCKSTLISFQKEDSRCFEHCQEGAEISFNTQSS